jgi:hypothetical protein
MGPFSNLLVTWNNLTSVTQARNRQAQQSLQAALSKGITANNYGPQMQGSAQTDESQSTANSTIIIPRAGVPEDDEPETSGIDVVLVGRRLHADNENISEQKQILSQDAVNDTPYVPSALTALTSESNGSVGTDSGDSNPPSVRPGASNVGGQDQTSIQDKKSVATTRTRLIELKDYPVRNRYGTIADVADVQAGTTAINVQEQGSAQTAILQDQLGLQTTSLGANNTGGQTVESAENLVTQAGVDLEAPVDESLCIDAVGTGTFHGSIEDITAKGIAASWQSSTGAQIAVDANISGGEGEAFNVMPQSQTSVQGQDTSSKVNVTPRAFVNRDDSLTASTITSESSSDNDQAQNGSQVAEVHGYGAAYNHGPAQQLNYQDSKTISSLDVVL